VEQKIEYSEMKYSESMYKILQYLTREWHRSIKKYLSVVSRDPNPRGQTLAKYWSNTGQILVKSDGCLAATSFRVAPKNGELSQDGRRRTPAPSNKADFSKGEVASTREVTPTSGNI
jgi:hypothetical protein